MCIDDMQCMVSKQSESNSESNNSSTCLEKMAANERGAKVERESILACMTCPLCHKLFRDATTITECLHTFCRKCIYKKISDEDLENCPVCNIDLGGVPVEKLRADHNLQDVRAKIFPLKRRKVEAPEAAPSVTSTAPRKERSLSSLVVGTPRVSKQTTMTGKRTKTFARKAATFKASSFTIEKTVTNEEESEEDHPESSSSPETLIRFSQNMRQNSSRAGPSQSTANKGKGNKSENPDGKLDLWKPLHCLVEVANNSNSFKSNSPGFDVKLEVPRLSDNGNQVQRAKTKGKSKFKVENGKDGPDPVSSGSSKVKNSRRGRPRKEEALGKSGISLQEVVDATSCRHERTGPIWFSLVPSKEQEGDSSLPQIPASYLRIKDGNVPVSYIQKYLMRKLDLRSEDEVEIKCMGTPVIPTLHLYELVDMWLQLAPTSQRIQTHVGSSAKDFVMVLTYSRRVHDS